MKLYSYFRSSASFRVRIALALKDLPYDRQSSALTSIDAQAEACRADIKSQQSQGWVMAEPAYTDDGVSGATLQRLGLRALLEDVGQDKIDMVVVHRLDRLSRSVQDVTDVIPLLDIQGVDLVSVTEPAINTSTSMGRLSLHILTSFAQFEREIIGERTRDKLAAMRSKGMWQGNGTPLGYTVDFEKRVVVVDTDARLVEDIFRRYLSSNGMTELISFLQKKMRGTKPG